MPEYRCADLLVSQELTAVVWRVAAGLWPGKALPPVVFPVAWKGYSRENDTHDYAYSVFLTTYFEPSELAAREGIRRAVGDAACDAEHCRFLKRFWQERSRYMDDQKTGGAGKRKRFRLRHLWMTWQPHRMPDFLEFVRWSAWRYTAHDPEIGWPAEVYLPEVSPVQRFDSHWGTA